MRWPLQIIFLVALSGCSSLPKKFDYTVSKDIVYQSYADGAVTGDLYRPKNAERAPMVIVIHGGGWRSRSGDMHSICEDLARRGFVAFNVTYRLAPQHHYPAATDDMQLALAFLTQHAAEYGGDPNRIYAWGYSAGSQLALYLGLDPKSGIKGIVVGGAPTDFTKYPHSPYIEGFLGKTIVEAPELWRSVSPISRVQDHSPPVFMYHGEADTLVGLDQVAVLKTELEKRKIKVETYFVSRFGHMSVYLFSQKSIDKGIEFLEKLDGQLVNVKLSHAN